MDPNSGRRGTQPSVPLRSCYGPPTRASPLFCADLADDERCGDNYLLSNWAVLPRNVTIESSCSYSLQEVVEDWKPSIFTTEPVDAVEGRLVVIDEVGNKFTIASPRDIPRESRKILGVGVVNIGSWDQASGEPGLVDTGEVDPELLRQIIGAYLNHQQTKKRPSTKATGQLITFIDHREFELDRLLEIARSNSRLR